MPKPSEGSHLLVYDANDNPLYEGWAKAKGAETSEAVWKIKKYYWSTGTGGEQVLDEEAWADGNELWDNIWDNRASLTYVRAA
jgi:hypothetical protein